MNRCIGCGIELQNINSNELGYTPKLDNPYCERCFKMIHYNKDKKVNNISNKTIIDEINKLNIMTIFITDLLSLNKKLIQEYQKIKNKKVLVINKCDLIPNNLKLDHLKVNIQKSFNIKEDVLFISAKNNLYLDEIIKLLNENQKVIFCGETSSGKSTLINQLMGSNLTTSSYNNTTLNFIKLKYQDILIYDTPGFIINTSKISLTKINSQTKTLKANFTYSLGNLKIQGLGNITCFLPNNLELKGKKEDTILPYEYEIMASDIELENGFIFIKNKCLIRSNQELVIRKSIISK